MINETNQLSEREREILQLVATGLSNQQIANQLGISVNTVKVHLRNVFGKTGVASRAEATMYAVRSGIVLVEQAALPDQAVVSVPSAPVPSDLDRPAVANELAPAEIEREPRVDLVPDQIAPPSTEVIASVPVVPVEVPPLPARGGSGKGARPIVLLAVVALACVLALGGAWALGWIGGDQAGQRNGAVLGDGADQAANGSERWQVLPGLPGSRAAFAVAGVANQLFVIGGENADGVTDSVERYDLGFQSWTALSAKPTPVTDVDAVVLGGRIYVPGGRRSSNAGDISDVFERYDPRTESWDTLANLPAPRSAYALAALEGKLYVFGGWDGQTYRNEVFEYDPSSDRWRELAAMPTPRAYAKAAVVDNGIYVLGGENANNVLPNNELFIPAREADQPWQRRPPMPQARSRFGLAVAPSFANVYVLGGGEDAAPLQYNTRSDSWQALAAPPEQIGSQPGVVEQEGQIIALGGKLGDGYLTTVQQYKALYALPVTVP